MIVLDENIHDRRIRDAIARWYQGQVVSIRDLRPGTVIKDDAIPTLLEGTAQPTFVTINAEDFWPHARPSHHYCILVLQLPKERLLEIPQLVRDLLQIEALGSKTARMGKIVRWSPTLVECYESSRRVYRIDGM